MGSDPPHHHPAQHSEQPLAEHDVVKMRARIADMGFASDARVHSLTSQEQELGGMVIRLLDSFIDPSQLLRQAEFITWLGSQRDLLVRSFEEERQRWEAEREGWNRMAEALLAQQARIGNFASGKDEEGEHQHRICESENKALREKVHDYQSRFSALESELNKLKPLLLMQPPISYPSTEHLSESKPLKTRKKIVDSPSGGEHANANDSFSTQPDDSIHDTPRSQYYRHRPQSRSPFVTPLQSRSSAQQTPMRSVFSVTQTPSSTHPGSSKRSKYKTKKSHHSNLLPLSADARTELLLLAARKIGRQRTHMISGFMRRIEKEREGLMQERDAERLDREKASAGAGHPYYRKDVIDPGTGSSSVTPSSAASMPKTPKRGSAEGQSTTHFLTPTTLMTPRSNLFPPPNNAPSSFVFVGSPPITSYQNSIFTPRPASHAQASSPAAKTARRVSATLATHPTPLASLLSAAKSMMDDESNEPSTHSNSRRRTGAVEIPDSPVPKRRRVGNGNVSGSSRGKVDMLAAASTLGTDRVRSALDVLADQAAAAFDSDWQSPSKSPDKVMTRSRGRERGYNNAAACPPVVSEEDVGDDLTPRGRVRSVEGSPGFVGTGSPVPTRSRSRVLLTERLSKGTSRSQQKKWDKSSSSSPIATRMILSPALGSRTLLLSPSPTVVTPPGVVVEDGDDIDGVGGDEESGPGKGALDDDDDLDGVSDSLVLLDNGKGQARGLVSIDFGRARSSPLRSFVAIDNDANNQEEIESELGNEFVMENHEDGVGSGVDGIGGGEEMKGVERILVGEGVRDGMMEEEGTRGHGVHGGEADDAYDTDADAEGEMDVEVEETVFVNSLGASDINDQLVEGPESRGIGSMES